MPPSCKHSGMYILHVREVASKKVGLCNAVSPELDIPSGLWTSTLSAVSSSTYSMVLFLLLSFSGVSIYYFLFGLLMGIIKLVFNSLVPLVSLSLQAHRTWTYTFPLSPSFHFYSCLLLVSKQAQKLPSWKRSFARKVTWLIPHLIPCLSPQKEGTSFIINI